jgi:dipeptidase
MCDTVVATPEATPDGITVFGKNSDREPNEAHLLVCIPAAEHPSRSRVKCTYIDIPQVEHTYAVLLAKPFWIWGAEMGANEHGLVIGNEAVFTRVPHEKGNALVGMDLLRLALERATTARDAVVVITELLLEHGQGGNCGFQHRLFYHNSFIMADPYDAWVLETAGPHWAARQVKGVYSISNGLTINREWDLASPKLVTYAVEQGWCKGPDDFDFARCYSDFLYTKFSDCRSRQCRTFNLLSSRQGDISVATVIAALRDHGGDGEGDWRPDKRLTGASVCMHAGFGPIRSSQTTGSMVSHLHPDHATHFVTGTAAPCTSIFKPVWLDAHLPDTGPVPIGTYNIASLYWRHESLHRSTLRDYATFIQLYRAERDTIEQEFVGGAPTLSNRTAAERSAFSTRCFAEADAVEARWLERLSSAKAQKRRNPLYAIAWNKLNRQAAMTIK